jgi:hypothetical protein
VKTAVVLVSVAVAWGALARDPGCGGADSPSSGPNAPCTRSKDCSAGLVCEEGVCTERDAGAVDASTHPPVDASDDGG